MTKASTPARITSLRPAIGIGAFEEAVAFYVDLLGFTLDWEWREAPGRPVIMSVSRDDISFMMNGYPGAAPAGAQFHFDVSDLQAYAAEINERQSDAASVLLGPPYDIPTISMFDPFGNVMHFEQPLAPEEEEARKERAVLMRQHVQKQIDQGQPLSTPEELVEAFGRPLGVAIDVLSRFPEYSAVANTKPPKD